VVVHRDDLLCMANLHARDTGAEIGLEPLLVSEQTNTNGRLSGGR
jgi:hypothetical protein